MEERRHSGEQRLTEQATLGDALRAMRDARNKSVTLHKPGSLITKDDGTRWIVQGNGTLREAGEDEV